MSDWCLCAQAMDSSYTLYKECPETTIVNVPDEILLTKEALADHFHVKPGTTKSGHMAIDSERTTLIRITPDLSRAVTKAYKAFGISFMPFLDWNGAQDESVLKQEFARRHPSLVPHFVKYGW